MAASSITFPGPVFASFGVALGVGVGVVTTGGEGTGAGAALGGVGFELEDCCLL